MLPAVGGVSVWKNILWQQRSRGPHWAGESSCSHHSGWPDVVFTYTRHSLACPTFGVWYENYAYSAIHPEHRLVQEGKQFSPCSFPSSALIVPVQQFQKNRDTGLLSYQPFYAVALREMLELSLNRN